MNKLTIDVIDAAMEVSVFVKKHEYPTEGSADFTELTRLLDKQEMALREAGFIPIWTEEKNKA